MEKQQVIIVSTRNQGKVREFTHALSFLGKSVQSMYDYPNVPEVVEDGATFSENAKKKAKEVGDFLGHPVLADDSGLCVEKLDGRPGVYSARYAGAEATDMQNNEKLLAELAELTAGEDTDQPLLSPAKFVCSLVYYDPADGSFVEAEGEVKGWITSEPAGAGGFGYDPLFYVTEYGKTMAELTIEEKQAISHRGHALKQLAEKLGAESRQL